MYIDAIKSLTPTQWEFFAENVLWHIGYEIIEGPSEGNDQGKDLIVRKENITYLVSCKHYINSGKSIGTEIEKNIADRVIRHNCSGFIAFYSTNSTSNLKSQFEQFNKSVTLQIKCIEFNQSDIFDIIPTMTGFTLQKYFEEPQHLYHHINKTGWEYFPLYCQNPNCDKDIISKENILSSRIQLVRVNNILELMYGCKSCLFDFGKSAREYNSHIETYKYLDGNIDIYWWEFQQIRYIEELTDLNNCIRLCCDNLDFRGVSTSLYKSWAEVQSAILQVMIPIHWGKFIDPKRILHVPEVTGMPLTDFFLFAKKNKNLGKQLIEKATNRKT